jgi:hypothetical protein
MTDHNLLTQKTKYILDEHKNVIPATLLEWAEYLESHHKERIVAKDKIDGHMVSTVFLGLDHSNICNAGKLEIFETMIFGKNSGAEEYCDRYATWAEAEEGHRRAIQWVKDGCKDD